MGTNLVVLLVLGLVVSETTGAIFKFNDIHADNIRFDEPSGDFGIKRVRREPTYTFAPTPAAPNANAKRLRREPEPTSTFAPPPMPAKVKRSTFAPTPAAPNWDVKRLRRDNVDYDNQYLGSYNKPSEDFGIKRLRREPEPTSTFAPTPAPAKAKKSTFAPTPAPAKAAASTFAPTPAPAQPKPKTYVYVDYNNQYLGTYNQPPEAFGFKRVNAASEGDHALGVNAASFYAVPYEAAQPAGGEVITVRVPSAPYGPVPVPLQRHRQAFPSYEDGKGLERDFNHHHHHDGSDRAVYHAGSHRHPNYDPIDFDPSYNFVKQEQRRRRPSDYRKYRVPYDHAQQLD